MSYQVIPLQAANQRDINQFYRLHRLNVNCHRGDEIVVVGDGTDIIGCGFNRVYKSLNNDRQDWLMRSLFINQAYRNQGLGTELVRALSAHHQGPLFTLCQIPLVPFYQQAGFEQCKPHGNLPIVWQKDIKKGLSLLLRP